MITSGGESFVCVQDWAKNTLADKLGVVDHSTIDYPPFRRSFYTETGALAKMTYEEVVAYRKELDDIKVCLYLCQLAIESSWRGVSGLIPQIQHGGCGACRLSCASVRVRQQSFALTDIFAELWTVSIVCLHD